MQSPRKKTPTAQPSLEQPVGNVLSQQFTYSRAPLKRSHRAWPWGLPQSRREAEPDSVLHWNPGQQSCQKEDDIWSGGLAGSRGKHLRRRNYLNNFIKQGRSILCVHCDDQGLLRGATAQLPGSPSSRRSTHSLTTFRNPDVLHP